MRSLGADAKSGVEMIPKELAIQQFVERKRIAPERIDNSKLKAGSLMLYYCHHCGTHTETLPEDHLFSPWRICSQCVGLIEQGWMEEARRV